MKVALVSPIFTVYAIIVCLDEAECFFDTKALDLNPNDLTT